MRRTYLKSFSSTDTGRNRMRRKAPFAQPRYRGIVTPFCRASRETRAWVGCYRKNALGLLSRAPGDAALGHPAGIKSSFQLSLGPLKKPVSSENL